MNTILLVSALLLLGLLALIFLYVFLHVMRLINYQINMDIEEEEEAISAEENEIQMEQFRLGFNKALTIAQVNLYKMWIDSGETVIIGSYDDIGKEMHNNYTAFFSDKKVMEEWNEKFGKFMNQPKDNPK